MALFLFPSFQNGATETVFGSAHGHSYSRCGSLHPQSCYLLRSGCFLLLRSCVLLWAIEFCSMLYLSPVNAECFACASWHHGQVHGLLLLRWQELSEPTSPSVEKFQYYYLEYKFSRSLFNLDRCSTYLLAFQYVCNAALTSYSTCAAILHIWTNKIFISTAHLKLHPLLALGVLVFAEHTLGVWGLLVAVPLAVFFSEYVIKQNPMTTGDGNNKPLLSLTPQ